MQQQTVPFLDFVQQLLPAARKHTVSAFPGPDITPETEFIFVEGIAFVSNTKHEHAADRAQQEAEVQCAEIDALKSALSADKQQLLQALQRLQTQQLMLQDYVITLSQTLLLVNEASTRFVLADGRVIMEMSAACAAAFDLAVSCIPKGDTL